jgi:hypothetical protein
VHVAHVLAQLTELLHHPNVTTGDNGGVLLNGQYACVEPAQLAGV